MEDMYFNKRNHGNYIKYGQLLGRFPKGLKSMLPSCESDSIFLPSSPEVEEASGSYLGK